MSQERPPRDITMTAGELEAARQVILEKQTQLFREGLVDGMRITLELLLGIPSSGGRPFTGELSPEAREWAQQNLRTIKSMEGE